MLAGKNFLPTFAVPFGEKFFKAFGSIAQLVQSVCLTSRGSGVRLPLLPQVHFWLDARRTSEEEGSYLVVMTARRCEVQRRRHSKERQKGGIAQLARASALQAEGRRFESVYLHKKSTLNRVLFLWRYQPPQQSCDPYRGMYGLRPGWPCPPVALLRVRRVLFLWRYQPPQQSCDPHFYFPCSFFVCSRTKESSSK